MKDIFPRLTAIKAMEFIKLNICSPSYIVNCIEQWYKLLTQLLMKHVQKQSTDYPKFNYPYVQFSESVSTSFFHLIIKYALFFSSLFFSLVFQLPKKKKWGVKANNTTEINGAISFFFNVTITIYTHAY